MRAIVALAVASFLWLGGLTARAQPLQDENLLLAPPAGFEVGHHQDSRDGVTLIEWVPAGETVQNWSEMVTVLVFRKRPDLDPEGLQGRCALSGDEEQPERLRLGDDADALPALSVDRQARDDDLSRHQGQGCFLHGPTGPARCGLARRGRAAQGIHGRCQRLRHPLARASMP